MSQTKRILILTADAGFGHRSAANAVAAALQELYGPACAVEIANPLDDKRLPALLRDSQADYDELVRNAPKLYNLGYELSDGAIPAAVIDSALTVMLFEVLHRLVRQVQPDAIVTTYPLYQAPLKAVCQVRRRHVPLLTVVTDLSSVHAIWFNIAVDQCLVPTTLVHDQALKQGLTAEQLKITGIPVHPNVLHAAGDKAALRTELGWRSGLTTALVVGSRRVGHLHDVLRLLDHAGLPLQQIIVAGGDEELYADLQAIEWHTPVHDYGFVDNLPTMMHAADCIICKAGGLIVSEALAVGLPLLLIDVLPGQEEGNAAYVIDGGAGEWAREPIAALEILFHWLDADGALLAERAANAQQMGRPRAAFDVAERAWAAAQQGPQTRHTHHQPAERSRLIAWLKQQSIIWEG